MDINIFYFPLALLAYRLAYLGRYREFEHENNPRRAYFYPRNWQFWIPRLPTAEENDTERERYGVYSEIEYRALVATISVLWITGVLN